MKLSPRNLTPDDIIQSLHAALRDANRASSGTIERRSGVLDINVRANEQVLAARLVEELETRMNAKRED